MCQITVPAMKRHLQNKLIRMRLDANIWMAVDDNGTTAKQRHPRSLTNGTTYQIELQGCLPPRVRLPYTQRKLSDFCDRDLCYDCGCALSFSCACSADFRGPCRVRGPAGTAQGFPRLASPPATVSQKGSKCPSSLWLGHALAATFPRWCR